MPMSRAEGRTNHSPMSTAEGLNGVHGVHGVHQEDNSLHDSLSRNACMQQSESNEKSDDGRVLKIAQKRQYVPGGVSVQFERFPTLVDNRTPR